MKQKFLSALSKLSQYSFFLPSDIYERHRYIGSFIPPHSNVLDIGGSLSRLTQFVHVKKCTTADIKPPADIIYDGKHIPVSDNSYDIVTSIDVLEHVPKRQRKDFITELIRIAKLKVIISAPYGSQKHIEYENEALAHFTSKGIPVPYLQEHVEIGLPTPVELKEYVREYHGVLYYSGDIRLTKILFTIHTFEVKNTYLNTIFFMLKLIFNAVMNCVCYYVIVNQKESENTNRFYLVIDKR